MEMTPYRALIFDRGGLIDRGYVVIGPIDRQLPLLRRRVASSFCLSRREFALRVRFHESGRLKLRLHRNALTEFLAARSRSKREKNGSFFHSKRQSLEIARTNAYSRFELIFRLRISEGFN